MHDPHKCLAFRGLLKMWMQQPLQEGVQRKQYTRTERDWQGKSITAHKMSQSNDDGDMLKTEFKMVASKFFLTIT